MKNLRHFGAKRILKLWLVVLAVSIAVVASPQPRLAYAEQEKQVREFVEAFNARNIDAMLGVVDESVQWLSVDGAKVTIETEGSGAPRGHGALLPRLPNLQIVSGVGPECRKSCNSDGTC